MITINKNWTLFLDRDGVINHENKGHYVTRFEDFIFHDQAIEAISTCTGLFKRILLITNQRGIGRGLMTEDQLTDIHQKMLTQIRQGNGNIEKIYYATDIDDSAINRKPNTGMAQQAKLDFPDIDFQQSIMVGNNLSDMEFGRRMDMKTVFVKSTEPDMQGHDLIDYLIDSLAELPGLLMSEES